MEKVIAINLVTTEGVIPLSGGHEEDRSNGRHPIAIAMRFVALAFVASTLGPVPANAAASQYPNMAPAAQYRIANLSEEVALARSAAPPAISGDAKILVLGAHGYETAVQGKNGFVCLVERSWDAGFNDPGFWNQSIRGPDCLNPAAARSVLPHFLERAKWVLAGLSKAEMIARTKAELAANRYALPEPGAMAFMMSKNQYLSDDGRHWHPHLMFFVANVKDEAWGADLPGSPVMAGHGEPDPVTTFFVPVRKWSDGTLDGMHM